MIRKGQSIRKLLDTINGTVEGSSESVIDQVWARMFWVWTEIENHVKNQLYREIIS